MHNSEHSNIWRNEFMLLARQPSIYPRETSKNVHVHHISPQNHRICQHNVLWHKLSKFGCFFPKLYCFLGICQTSRIMCTPSNWILTKSLTAIKVILGLYAMFAYMYTLYISSMKSFVYFHLHIVSSFHLFCYHVFMSI